MRIKIASKGKKIKKMIEDIEARLGTLGKGKGPLQITQGLGEDEEQDSGDEEDEAKEVEKSKYLIIIMPPSKKAQRTKKKKEVTPPSPNKPRTRAIAMVEQSTKHKVDETTKLSEPRTKRRRLVRGPPQKKQNSIDEVCLDLKI